MQARDEMRAELVERYGEEAVAAVERLAAEDAERMLRGTGAEIPRGILADPRPSGGFFFFGLDACAIADEIRASLAGRESRR
jgi:hypothetical protein